MDNEPRLAMAVVALALAKQDVIIKVLTELLRPFAKAANAQQHTDCGGLIEQSDWERVTQVIAAADKDLADAQMREARATHAH